MKLEISYGSGVRHELALAAEVAVLGRDPNCDVVLNDSKCSRRHATLENGADGVVVRDTGSANGVYVNGRRVQMAPLGPADSLRLGDVTIRLLPEVGETVVVAPEDLELKPLTPEPARPAPPLPAPRVAERSSPRLVRPAAAEPLPATARRPLTVTLLAVLWALVAPAIATALLLIAHRLDAGWLGWAAAAAGALAVAGAGGAMVFGLLTLAPWSRHLQIAAAALGLLICPLTPASATVLLYLTRAEVRHSFERRARAAAPGGEPAFALTVVATLVLGAAASAAFVLLFTGGARH
jgi:hypothetical protein